nr:D-isomer specific 2-hydroxyacid dehydrogenase family protein [Rhodococcus trifolii]
MGAELTDAVTSGGGTVVPLDDADALVWKTGPQDFPTLPANVRWVQLGSAGVEQWGDEIAKHPDVTFTSAAGAYSDIIAEHALMMLLAGVRTLPAHLAATSWQNAELADGVGTLRGSTVTIVGAGGIGRSLISMLAPLGVTSIAVNRSGRDVPGATRTVTADELDEVWDDTDHVVIAAPATAETAHIVGADRLHRLKAHSWVVNIARGSLVDTDALVEALRTGTIAGAGLDVTDPEPLPDGHPLWTMRSAMITPHDSNPTGPRTAALARHVEANVARFAAGEPLAAVVDRDAGY